MAQLTYSKIRPIKDELPLIALRDVVIFPGVLSTILVKREKSIRAFQEVVKGERLLAFVAQKRKDIEDPKPSDLYSFGVVAGIKESVRLPDGAIRLLIEGLKRIRIKEFLEETPYFKVRIEFVDEIVRSTPELDSLMRMVIDQFKQVVALGEMIPLDALINIFNITNPARLSDLITFNLDL